MISSECLSSSVSVEGDLELGLVLLLAALTERLRRANHLNKFQFPSPSTTGQDVANKYQSSFIDDLVPLRSIVKRV